MLMKLSVFLIAWIGATSVTVSADSDFALRERKVDLGEGVSLQVVEAGQIGLNGYQTPLKNSQRCLR